MDLKHGALLWSICALTYYLQFIQIANDHLEVQLKFRVRKLNPDIEMLSSMKKM